MWNAIESKFKSTKLKYIVEMSRVLKSDSIGRILLVSFRFCGWFNDNNSTPSIELFGGSKNTPSSSTQCNWRDSFLPSSKGSLPTNIEARVVNHKKTFERYLHSTYSYISFENHGELSNFKQEIRKIINVQIENFVGSVTVSKQYTGSSTLFQCQ